MNISQQEILAENSSNSMVAIDSIVQKMFHCDINLAFRVLNQQVQLIVPEYAVVSIYVFNRHQSTCKQKQIQALSACSA